MPDLKVAGMDGWVTVTASDIVSVTAGLDAGDREGDELELWLVAGTSRGNFSYVLDTGWVVGVQPAWQGAVHGFDSFDVWADTLPFGTGEYWIGFAVDDDVNGLLDTTWVDLAAVEVHPTPGWETAIGGPGRQTGSSVQQTSDGGYILAGQTYTGEYDAYVVKTDDRGEVLWTKTLDFPGIDYATSIQQTADGGFVVTGTVQTAGPDDDVFLTRLDSRGEPLWTRTFGGTEWDWGRSVHQSADGGFVLGGTTFSFGAGGPDFFLIKTDTEGGMIWAKTYGGTSSEYFGSVEPTADGGYVLVGDTFSYGAGNADVYLVRTDAQGEPVWDKTFGDTEFDWGSAVQQTRDGGFIVSGHATPPGAIEGDAYLIRTDASGEAVWEKTFGGDALEDGLSVRQTTEGGFLMAGLTSSFGVGVEDVYLVKTDAEGQQLWAKTFGGPDYDGASAVIETADGAYVVAGTTVSYDDEGDGDIYLIRVDVAE